MQALDQVTVRVATAADANCLAVLATQVWLDTYATHGIREAIAVEVLGSLSPQVIGVLLGRSDVNFRLAETGDHVIGFSQWTFGTRQRLVPGNNPAELDRLYVQEPFTRRGVGTLLLDASERSAREQGVDVIWLTPWVHNQRALQFYGKVGYSDLGRSDFHLGTEVHENRVLAKQLRPDRTS